MRHTSESGFPESVELLPSSVILPAALAALVTSPSLTYGTTTRRAAAFPGAIPLPTVAPRAHHHLSLALAAYEHPPVRQCRALLAGAANACESDGRALYCSQRGPRPANGSGVGLHTLRPLPFSFRQRLSTIRGLAHPSRPRPDDDPD